MDGWMDGWVEKWTFACVGLHLTHAYHSSDVGQLAGLSNMYQKPDSEKLLWVWPF